MAKPMAEKTCLVTGANSGIGKAISLALSGCGAKLVMVCRDRVKGESALEEIRTRTGNPGVELFIMDLSSRKSIRNGVLEIKKKYESLNVLVNNAGTLLFEKRLTEDGIETTFAVNCLGPFLLTNLLLDLLEKGSPSRIVNVVSEGVSGGCIDFDVLMCRTKFKPVAAYSQAKQAEILLTYELAERLKGTGIVANCYYPGLVRTNLGRAEKGIQRLTYAIMVRVLKSAFTPMEESVKLGIWLAASKTTGEITGKFFKRHEDRVIVRGSNNGNIQRKLWELCEELTRDPAPIPAGP